MELEKWIEAPDNIERNCDVCGELIIDSGTQVADLYVCDGCYEDM